MAPSLGTILLSPRTDEQVPGSPQTLCLDPNLPFLPIPLADFSLDGLWLFLEQSFQEHAQVLRGPPKRSSDMNEATATALVFLSRCPGTSFGECSLEMEPGSDPGSEGETESQGTSRSLGAPQDFPGARGTAGLPPTCLRKPTCGPERTASPASSCSEAVPAWSPGPGGSWPWPWTSTCRPQSAPRGPCHSSGIH